MFYPSYALPLMKVSAEGNRATKAYGHCRGLELVIEEDGLYVVSNSKGCVEYASYLSGSWHRPEEHVAGVSRSVRSLISVLLTEYGDMGVPTSPLDDMELFTAIFLSRNTNYHRNTVPWVEKILKEFRSIESLVHAEPQLLKGRVCSSYQVIHLPEALKCYLDLRKRLITEGPESSRLLLKCRGVGPKTLHAYMLFVKLVTNYAPVDVNLIKLLSRLEVFNLLIKHSRPPIKKYCTSHACEECPLGNSCLESLLSRELGLLAGWFQTVAYLHNRLYCSRLKCSECVLKDFCLRDEVLLELNTVFSE